MSKKVLKKRCRDEEEAEAKEMRRKDPPECVPWFDPNELQATDRNSMQGLGTSGTRRMVSSARHQDTSPGAEPLSRPGPGRHHPMFIEETRPGAILMPGIHDDGLTIEEGNDEQSSIASNEESTVHVFARVVDTEAENRNLRALDQAVREQDQMRHELDRAAHERDQLRQMLDNAAILTPVIVTHHDVENGDENVHANHDDLLRRDDHKCGHKGRRWFAMSVILLILVAIVTAIAVTLTMVLQSEPTLPGPTTTVPSTQEPTTLVPSTREPTTLAPTAEPITPQDSLIELLASASSDGGVALADPSTPQNMALKWIAGDPNLASYTDQQKIERYALATLYYTTGGDSWNHADYWLTYEDVCGKWYNFNDTTIYCTTDGAVSDLDLRDNNLQGVIPPEISMLSDSLDFLWLDDNGLEGDIPTAIGELTKLTSLALLNNSLIGTIPNHLGLLTKLMGLELDNNLLTGTIPPFIGMLTDLDFLDFGFNNLSGKIPSELGILTKLTYLGLGSNEFTGTIPKELGLLTKLTHLDLSLNGFTGSVPTSLASLTLLSDLYLDDNQLTGSLDAFCSIDFEMFVANTCGQVEIDCQCCTHCCYLSGSCESI